ncbi:MAG: hypothetical protein H6556_25095 [Lewinellaceae bacterium]|nr:hypothetical protein [Lewinellaceae bacterium]
MKTGKFLNDYFCEASRKIAIRNHLVSRIGNLWTSEEYALGYGPSKMKTQKAEKVRNSQKSEKVVKMAGM